MTNLVILHGWQSSKEKWQKTKELLEEQGIRVFSPDLPGFKKQNELSEAWDLNDYIKWFKGYCLTGLSNSPGSPEERFFLLGHSFGGRIAIKYAAQNPKAINGLILVSSAGIKPKQDSLSLIFLALAKNIKLIFLKIPLLRNLSPIIRKFFYKYILRKSDYLKAEKIPFLKETFKKIISEDLTPHLSQITTPCLIVWGEKDKETPLSDAYLMAQTIQNSELKVLKDIGHAPHLDNPELLAKKIINFIKK